MEGPSSPQVSVLQQLDLDEANPSGEGLQQGPQLWLLTNGIKRQVRHSTLRTILWITGTEGDLTVALLHYCIRVQYPHSSSERHRNC